MDSGKQVVSNGRTYVVTFDPTRNTIIVTNIKGEAIEAERKSNYAIKVSVDGNKHSIDLKTDPNAQFYNDLLDKAWQSQAISDEARFFEEATAAYDEDISHLKATLNIAVVGKVSSGKSSLINALLMRSRFDPIAEVGVEAGVTTNLKIIKLDENVRLIDSPGIDDIKRENSDVTRDFLANIDVGILVLTGAANESQKDVFEDLRRRCSGIFVALNKIDMYDQYSEEALVKVLNQWRICLGADKIYPVCTFGYDPDLSPSTELMLRGIDDLRSDIEGFLESKQKKLLR